MIEHVEAKGLSQRAVCRYTGVSRAVCRYKLRRPAQDAQFLEKMRAAARANPGRLHLNWGKNGRYLGGRHVQKAIRSD